MAALHPELVGRRVQFRVRDVHLPDAAVVLDQLHGNDLLQGRVIEFTERAIDGGLFLVIDVDGLLQPVVLASASVTALDSLPEADQ